jgi:hypothetical protein
MFEKCAIFEEQNLHDVVFIDQGRNNRDIYFRFIILYMIREYSNHVMSIEDHLKIEKNGIPLE